MRINYQFLASALKQQGSWQGKDINIDLDWCLIELEKIITSLDWKATAQDVRRFVRVTEQPSLDFWSKDLFITQLKKLK